MTARPSLLVRALNAVLGLGLAYPGRGQTAQLVAQFDT